MGQLSLLTPPLNADPKAPRAQRMGSVERRHWAAPSPTDDPWTLDDAGWSHPVADPRPLLIGVDEAGRGPLAGPVSVAAALLRPDQLAFAPWAGRLDDSKRLKEAARTELFEILTHEAPAWAIVHVHADHIDRVNILQATFHGMCIAVELALGLTGEGTRWEHRPDTSRAASAREGTSSAWYADQIDASAPPLGADALYKSLDQPTDASAHLLIDGHKPFSVPGAAAARLTQHPVVKGDALSHHIAAASILAKHSRDALMIRAAGLWPGFGFEGHKGYPTRTHIKAVEDLGPCPIHRRTFGPVARSIAKETESVFTIKPS